VNKSSLNNSAYQMLGFVPQHQPTQREQTIPKRLVLQITIQLK